MSMAWSGWNATLWTRRSLSTVKLLQSAFQSSNPIGQYRLYMHMRCCPNPNPTNQIRASKWTYFGTIATVHSPQPQNEVFLPALISEGCLISQCYPSWTPHPLAWHCTVLCVLYCIACTWGPQSCDITKQLRSCLIWSYEWHRIFRIRKNQYVSAASTVIKI